MRIGILTFHCAINYGAVLQCYALQEYLVEKGHDVQVIDYCPQSITKDYNAWCWERVKSKSFVKGVKCLLSEIKNYPIRYGRQLSFGRFRKRNIKCVSTNELINNNFDYVIVGSDQVWNYNITKGFDKYYWGAFGHKESVKIISYGASMQDTWPSMYNEKISQLLQNFSSISVRESTLRDALSKITNKEIVSVCDPTFLLNKEQWDNIADNCSESEPYVFLYMVNCNNEEIEAARIIAQEKGMNLIYLSGLAKEGNSKGMSSASPSKMLGLIKNASLVIASSFHGTAFSLIFQKDFISIRHNNGKDNRVLSLLKPLGLVDHFVTISECIEFCRKPTTIKLQFDLAQISNTGKLFLEKTIH